MGYYARQVRTPTVKREIINNVSGTSGTVTPYIDTGYVHGNIVGWHVRNGVSMPNWREKITRGENATTRFSGTLQSPMPGSNPTYYRATRWNGNMIDTVDCEFYATHCGLSLEIPWITFTSQEIAATSDQALAKFLDKYRARTSSFQGLVFGGELRETLRMLRHPTQGVINLLDAFFVDVYRRNGRYKKRDRIKRSSDLWLEYSFGLNPLLNDLDDAIKAYRKLGEADRRTKLSATAKMSKYTDSGKVGASGQASIPMFGRQFERGDLSVRYLAGVLARAELPPYNDALLRFGLTAGHIGAALWELTPWSWLLDYFSNIGDIIEAGLTDTSDIKWVCRTVRSSGFRQYYQEANKKAWFAANGISIEGSPGYTALETRVVERYPTAPMVPMLHVGIPGLGRKWLNMGAVIASRNRALLSF